MDLFIIVSFVAVMAVLRDVARLYFFEPLARRQLTKNLKRKKQHAREAKGKGTYSNGHANGHSVKAEEEFRLTRSEERQMNRSVVRFAEQGWAFVYYTIQCAFGIYVHYQLPTKLLNPKEGIWSNYPNIPLPGPIKFYYLNETAFYLHGLFILNAEARRKDHWQMMTHHVVAVALMFLSYSLNITRVGCLIMVLMDWCDVVLPLAKMFKYLENRITCDSLFGLFMVSWFVTRHVLFIRLIHSTMYDLPRKISLGWEPKQGRFMTQNVHYSFVVLLVVLQILQLVWFTMVIKVAYKVLIGQGAEDVRTDDEDDEIDEEEKKTQ